MYKVTEIGKSINTDKSLTLNKRTYIVDNTTEISNNVSNLIDGIYTKEKMKKEKLNVDVISKVYDENNRIIKEFDNHIFKNYIYDESIENEDEEDVYYKTIEYYDLDIAKDSNLDPLAIYRTDYYDYKDEERRYLTHSVVDNIETIIKYDENNNVIYKSVMYIDERKDNETLEEYNTKIMDVFCIKNMVYNEYGDIISLTEVKYAGIENDKFVTSKIETKFKYDSNRRLVYKFNNVGEFNIICYASKNDNCIILDETEKEIKHYNMNGDLLYECNHITGYEKFYIRDRFGRLVRSKDSDGNEDVIYYDACYNEIIYEKHVEKIRNDNDKERQ